MIHLNNDKTMRTTKSNRQQKQQQQNEQFCFCLAQFRKIDNNFKIQ